MVSQHADFSPSGSEKRYLCPASYAVERNLPDTESEYSQEGTDWHELGAACLRSGNRADFYLGKRMSKGNVVDEEMVSSADIYADKVREYAAGHTLLVEQRVTYAPLVKIISDEEGWGTSDVVIITSDGEELQIHDGKGGRGIKVDAFTEETPADVREYLDADPSEERETAKGNRQLMDYALGAYNEFALLGNFKRIRLVIHQPRLGHLSEWDCTIEELMAFAKEEEYAIQQCLNARTIHESTGLEASSSYFNPGLKQCRFCLFAGQCASLAEHVRRVVLPNDVESSDPAALSEAQLGTALDEAPLVSVWLKAVRAEAERRAFAGAPPIGKSGAYKLVRGRRGNRKWLDEDLATAALKNMRLKKDQMYELSLISPTQAERLLKKAKPRLWTRINTEDFITQNEGGISLAPATDKRPAYVPENPADDFQDISGEKNVSSQAA